MGRLLLLAVLNQPRRRMKIAGYAPFCFDVTKDARNLLRREPDLRSNFDWIVPMIFAVEHEVHFLVRQAEIEFLLRLWQRVGVCSWRSLEDYVRYLQVLRQLIHLRLVQMSDRLQIGGAVAEFDKETLIIFQPIWRARDGVVQPI